jgi:hypothetical protein
MSQKNTNKKYILANMFQLYSLYYIEVSYKKYFMHNIYTLCND